MSASNINFIMNLWAASLAQHRDVPPFRNAQSMYNTIDTTLLGDILWQSFTLKYNGDLPDGEVPAPWMEADFNAWYRDPHTFVHNIISNPDFKDEFDYTPYQEYSNDSQHHFQDMMFGDWAWKQAVSATWFTL